MTNIGGEIKDSKEALGDIRGHQEDIQKDNENKKNKKDKSFSKKPKGKRKHIESVFNDNDFQQTENNLKERDELYSKILCIYHEYIGKSLDFKSNGKEKVKKTLSLIMILLGIFFIIISIFIMKKINENNLSPEIIIAFITVIAPILTSFLSTMNKYVEFIYNPKETEQVGTIIQNIQNYDIELRKSQHEHRKLRNDINKEKNN